MLLVFHMAEVMRIVKANPVRVVVIPQLSMVQSLN